MLRRLYAHEQENRPIRKFCCDPGGLSQHPHCVAGCGRGRAMPPEVQAVRRRLAETDGGRATPNLLAHAGVGEGNGGHAVEQRRSPVVGGASGVGGGGATHPGDEWSLPLQGVLPPAARPHPRFVGAALSVQMHRPPGPALRRPPCPAWGEPASNGAASSPNPCCIGSSGRPPPAHGLSQRSQIENKSAKGRNLS